LWDPLSHPDCRPTVRWRPWRVSMIFLKFFFPCLSFWRRSLYSLNPRRPGNLFFSFVGTLFLSRRRPISLYFYRRCGLAFPIVTKMPPVFPLRLSSNFSFFFFFCRPPGFLTPVDCWFFFFSLILTKGKVGPHYSFSGRFQLGPPLRLLLPLFCVFS